MDELRSAITSSIRAQLKCVAYLEDGPTWREKISTLVQRFSELPQVECPLKHYFAPGIYIREIFMPSGSIVIGKIHKTEHFNIIQRGCVSLISENGEREVKRGPTTFVSGVGVQKVLYIHEDTVWSTVHVTDERDLEKLETQLIESAGYPLFDRSSERAAIQAAASEQQSIEVAP